MGKIELDMNTKFTNDKHRAVVNVMFTSNWLRQRFDATIKPYGLSNAQFNILRILRGANDWLSMTEVKNRMIEKSPNATRLCDKLCDKGYIERTRNENDRRSVSLKISSHGLEILHELDVLTEKNPLVFFENITTEEAQALSEILDKLRG